MLTKLFVKDMKERGSGNILNVGSIAGFLPGPLLSSYYASKNYVVRLSEAVHEELRREGSRVKVSVLCPGPVKTEFNQVAGVNFIVEGLKSSYVARYAIDKALKGKMVIIPGKSIKLLKLGARLLGEKRFTRISYTLQMQRKD